MPGHNSSIGDRIAQGCLDAYNELGPKGKPRLRKDGVREWSVLAGFVLVDTVADRLEVVSLGTGIKCLPADKLPLHGDILHDSHAEIIARRGLLLWLYEQLGSIDMQDELSSPYFEASQLSSGIFRLRNELRLAMYVSTLPCGDASMGLLARLQDPDVAAIFTEDQPNEPSLSVGVSRGRKGFRTQGALRTKPARGDAVTTTSLSCSDKLASYTALGVQGALLSLLIEPIYVSMYVFGGVQQEHQQDVKLDCERALHDRLGNMPNLQAPYCLSRPEVFLTTKSYLHAKRNASPDFTEPQAGCHESLSWIKDLGVEVISQGIKHGAPVKHGQPQQNRAISRLCRLKLFRTWCNLQAHLLANQSTQCCSDITYRQAKQRATAYQHAKSVLRAQNDSPFSSWIVNDARFQQFRDEGR